MPLTHPSTNQDNFPDFGKSIDTILSIFSSQPRMQIIEGSLIEFTTTSLSIDTVMENRKDWVLHWVRQSCEKSQIIHPK